MDEFLAYVLQFGNLSQHQLDLIVGKGTTLSLRKEAYLLKAGQVARQVTLRGLKVPLPTSATATPALFVHAAAVAGGGAEGN
ncbi:hypothetical protein [Hymenobacter coccineus]|uniref:Uncharacterized protein n=1 Tax=Hymenobacter coccineus TaxID=1908235 RepID=A0A1G1TJG1_9BACT|nr:hypothetical protein [Hymenobacter coccineus]OGX91006.1 hypothetical protein BEN49_21435 [Hymenobacter coccineus]